MSHVFKANVLNKRSWLRRTMDKTLQKIVDVHNSLDDRLDVRNSCIYFCYCKDCIIEQPSSNFEGVVLSGADSLPQVFITLFFPQFP